MDRKEVFRMNSVENRILPYISIAFLSLAVLSAEVGDRPSSLVTLDLQVLAAAIDNEDDHLAPDELRTMLSSGRGVQVVDLRDSASFYASRIPGAMRSTVARVLNIPTTHGIPIILYSDGGIHAAQAWMLLKAKGVQEVYTLLGGWEAWIALNDTSGQQNTTATPGRKQYAKPSTVSRKRETLRGDC
jgi:rhodanese-related sulfurtransferase